MKDQNNINACRSFFLRANRDYVNSYNHVAERFIKYHFLLNAGAASILALFFLEKGENISYLQWAVLSFILGTLLSILAILLDFFWGYFSLRNFEDNFFNLDKNISVVKEQINKYMDYQEKNKYNLNFTITIRIINGLLSYIAFLIGLFIIIYNKSSSGIHTFYLWVFLFVFLYSLILIITIKKCIKPLRT